MDIIGSPPSSVPSFRGAALVRKARKKQREEQDSPLQQRVPQPRKDKHEHAKLQENYGILEKKYMECKTRNEQLEQIIRERPVESSTIEGQSSSM